MSDAYQATYDAVRSRISNCDIGQAVSEAIRDANLAHYVECAATVIGYEACKAANEYARPSAVYRPRLSIDGNQWCALYGENLQEGVAGFGDTPAQAMDNFDSCWVRSIARAKGKA